MPAAINKLLTEYATVQYNDPVDPIVNWSAPLNNHPFWEGSVAEAIYLIGGERNSGKVLGASYAPTLANNNSIQWGECTPDPRRKRQVLTNETQAPT